VTARLFRPVQNNVIKILLT